VNKKIKNFLCGSLDYPINNNGSSVSKENPGYYLNFLALKDSYLAHNLQFDMEGIPRFDYSIVPRPNNRNGCIYNITYICWYALGCLQEYLDNGDSRAKDGFVKQADWLMEHASIYKGHISWPIDFPWNLYGTWLPIPRVSSMDQGLAISVLIRAYLLTSQDSYLKKAKEAEEFYDLPLQRGGFNYPLKNGSIFYEMYPSVNPSLILDGHIFSMMGLYDLYSAIPDTQTKRRFEAGLEAVDYYDPPNLTFPFGAYICVVDIDRGTGEGQSCEGRVEG